MCLVLLGYLWAFTETGGFRPSKSPEGYYGLLTDALLSGQLHLKVEPDVRLAQLANPWLSYQGIPRMHDATYFHGHYYIYFGVTPVALYFAPVKLLTGRFPTEGSAGVVFALVGFLAGAWLLRRMMDFQANRPGVCWQGLGIVVWGFANFAFVDAQATNFYTVPILCAFACLMVAMAAIERALSSSDASAAAGFIAAASLAWALSVGGRPHYVMSLPLIGIPVGFLLTRDSGRWAKGNRLLVIACAVFPAAVIGFGLAWYNYARFGSIAEFGFRYQFTSNDNRFIQMWNPRLIIPNLLGYSLTDGLYLVYFPFFAPIGLLIGFLAWCPITAAGALLPATLLHKRLRKDPRWICIAFCVAIAGAIHLFCLCILPIGVDRYNVDFVPEFLLAALFTAIAYFGAGPVWPRPAQVFIRSALAAAALVSVAKILTLALDRSPNLKQKRWIAMVFNWPTAEAQQLTGGLKGPISLDLSFAPLTKGARTPLISTGIGSDYLFAEGLGNEQMRLGFIHEGNAPLYGPSEPAKPGVHRQLVADLGSFYPPDAHPFFRKWNQDILDALHRRVLVKLDGEIALSGHSNFYPADSRSIRYCTPPKTGAKMAPFSGVLYKVIRLPFPTETEIRSTGWTGPVRLHLKFPIFTTVHSEPLLSTGSAQAADMLFVTYLGLTTVRFGHDSTGGGGVDTAEVQYDPAVEHVLDVGLGSLEAPQGAIPSPVLGLRLVFDGRWLAAIPRKTHPSFAYQNLFGYNVGLGSASESFSGDLVAEHIDPPMPKADALGGKGPIEVTLRFVPMPPDIFEPLVVSGVTGRGDLVYVHYLSGNQIQLGVDHWGIGSSLGKSMPVQDGVAHTLIVSSAAFLPAADSPEWGATPHAIRDHLLTSIEIYLDGKKIIDAPWIGFQTAQSQIAIGTNPIGGSTTGPLFSGVVLTNRRCPLENFVATVAGR